MLKGLSVDNYTTLRQTQRYRDKTMHDKYFFPNISNKKTNEILVLTLGQARLSKDQTFFTFQGVRHYIKRTNSIYLDGNLYNDWVQCNMRSIFKGASYNVSS